MVGDALWTQVSERGKPVAEAEPWRGEWSAKKLCGQARSIEDLLGVTIMRTIRVLAITAFGNDVCCCCG